MFKSHSVAEVPSTSGQTAAGLPIRNHTLGTSYVPALPLDRGQTPAETLAGRPPNTNLPEQQGRGAKPALAHVAIRSGPLSVVNTGLYTTSSHNTQSPVKVLDIFAAVQIAQKSASLTRRASLAAKLQRLAESADTRNIKAAERGSPALSAAPTERNSVEDCQVDSMPRATKPLSKKRISLGKVSSADLEDSQDSGPTAEQTSNAVDSKAADVRRQHLSDSDKASALSSRSRQPADPLPGDSLQCSNTGITFVPRSARSAEEPGTTHSVIRRCSSEISPVLKRTLSDAASEALDAVESMQCPIIAYSQLHIQRKIGDGSIGQVGALPVVCTKGVTGN